jgi:predicted nucleotidyltransferase
MDHLVDRETALNTIRAHKAELSQYHVKSLAIFGSVAREEASGESDVDILVEFNQPVGMFEFIRLQRFLATILGCSVDLATPDALREPMRAQILEESVRA